MDSGSNIKGRDAVWKYCTYVEGDRNGIICNHCGLVIKSGGICKTREIPISGIRAKS